LSDFNQGLIVSVVGLLITFTALGIFILVMVVLKKLFPYKAESEEGADEDEETYEDPTMSAAIETSGGEDEEMAAAIGALIFLRGQQSNQLGAALLEGPGRFWTAKQPTNK
jgi:sodium pump decarboxylase gamma subunit